MLLRCLFALLFVFICSVRAGTWLAFNWDDDARPVLSSRAQKKDSLANALTDDFDGDGGFGDHSARGNIRDLVHACRQNPKVAQDGYAEHEAMCRILLRMTRSA